jgi:hypothetical protein
MAADNSIDLYKMMGHKLAPSDGIKIIKAVTVDPDPLTFIFEGTKKAIGPDIFEIPINMYPIRKDDRFTVYKMSGQGPASRWALLNKLNGATVNLGTMQDATSAKIDGVDKTYGPDELIVPMGLLQGDRVLIVPIYDGAVKYAVTSKMN